MHKEYTHIIEHTWFAIICVPPAVLRRPSVSRLHTELIESFSFCLPPDSRYSLENKSLFSLLITAIGNGLEHFVCILLFWSESEGITESALYTLNVGSGRGPAAAFQGPDQPQTRRPLRSTVRVMPGFARASPGWGAWRAGAASRPWAHSWRLPAPLLLSAHLVSGCLQLCVDCSTSCLPAINAVRTWSPTDTGFWGLMPIPISANLCSLILVSASATKTQYRSGSNYGWCVEMFIYYIFISWYYIKTMSYTKGTNDLKYGEQLLAFIHNVLSNCCLECVHGCPQLKHLDVQPP